MLSSKKRRDRTFFEGVVDGPLRFKGVDNTTEPKVIEILWADNVLIGRFPNIREIEFIRIISTIESHIIFLFGVEIKNWIIEILIVVFCIHILIWSLFLHSLYQFYQNRQKGLDRFLFFQIS